MIDWLTVTSCIEINKRNKEEMIKIIKALRKIEAINSDTYETLMSSAECVQ